MRKLEQSLAILLSSNVGRLILRISLGGLMLFHGIHKAKYGIDGIKFLVVKASLPEFLAYGVYIGEIVLPILIILGLYTRVSSIFMAVNMLFAIFLTFGNSLFSMGTQGSIAIELPLLYLLMSISLLFIGAGKYSLDGK